MYSPVRVHFWIPGDDFYTLPMSISFKQYIKNKHKLTYLINSSLHTTCYHGNDDVITI